MSKSTRRSRSRKTADRPKKPYPDFPLTPHSSGKWQKKIRGRIYYFGSWGKREDGKLVRVPGDGWEEALAIYKAQADDLHAGRTPRVVDKGGLTVKELGDRFLTAKLRKVESGELSPRTLAEYRQTAQRVADEFGKDRRVADLAADDFERLRASIAKTCGPVRLGNEITRIKSLFKYALDYQLIDRPVNFGQEFKKPSKATMRKHRAASDKKLFTAEEIRCLLGAADTEMRTAILLGINAGLGGTDIADLQESNVDLKSGWLDYPRGKTGIGRRIPLWPETVAALRTALAERPEPKQAEDARCVLLSARGERLVRLHEKSRTDGIAHKFGSLLRKLKINGRRGLGHYSLRHTLATVGLQTGDRDAVKAIMGHAERDVLSLYDETGPNDDRLKAVVQHVHDWLFGQEGGER